MAFFESVRIDTVKSTVRVLDAESNRVVSDGYYRSAALDGAPPGKGRERGRWITAFHLDWRRLEARTEPLCRHDGSWDSQGAHPYPIFAPDGRSVWFTSDFEGRRAVYEVDASA